MTDARVSPSAASIAAVPPGLSSGSPTPQDHIKLSDQSIVLDTEQGKGGDIETQELPAKLYNGEQGADTEISSPADPFVTHPKLANLQYGALCWSLFMAGWNDASTGPLLPRIQEVYHVGFTVVSVIFIVNCVGFVSGSVSNIWLTSKFGFGKAIVFGALLQLVGYALQSSAPPFPVFAIGFAFNGFGLSLQDAQANGFVASYQHHAATRMGILHGVYGLGALCSPLVATQFAQLRHWSFHYLCSLGVAFINILWLTLVFRFKTQDECLAEIGQKPGPEDTSESGHYKQIFRLRTLHILAFFTLVYVGVEVTIGGWIVTYIIQERGGGASSGYVSSGFFGGLALGRVALLKVNSFVGERLIIFLYILLSLGLELIVWLVPSLIGDAVAVSFVGFFLGPIYPIMMNESGRILPRWLLTGCIGWIAGLGQAGSAALPFMSGAIAGSAGISSLQPLLISMMGLLLVLWALVPRHKVEPGDD